MAQQVLPDEEWVWLKGHTDQSPLLAHGTLKTACLGSSVACGHTLLKTGSGLASLASPGC